MSTPLPDTGLTSIDIDGMRATMPAFESALAETGNQYTGLEAQVETLGGNWTGEAASVFLGAMRQWLEDFSSVRSKLQTIYEKFEADTGNYQAVHSNTVDEANALKNAIAGGLPGF
ncbi:WXG100 family type VII secretion target [Actinacidiphila sp. DG2A-62]|uniref:WXG100 family type VII secretion target n=1 Tax=Actinacidiphila sp. DG2A-62 TaxID=3108821 RepID=UPI002DB8DAD5|nr:WXG100 family type VII secretion target [Actinacidiphila sp. DG2A-62]MEC3993796.1 WXG100 family type VII secretion target [Actinacidiphila sp. DG2A-62]